MGKLTESQIDILKYLHKLDPFTSFFIRPYYIRTDSWGRNVYSIYQETGERLDRFIRDVNPVTLRSLFKRGLITAQNEITPLGEKVFRQEYKPHKL